MTNEELLKEIRSLKEKNGNGNKLIQWIPIALILIGAIASHATLTEKVNTLELRRLEREKVIQELRQELKISNENWNKLDRRIYGLERDRGIEPEARDRFRVDRLEPRGTVPN